LGFRAFISFCAADPSAGFLQPRINFLLYGGKAKIFAAPNPIDDRDVPVMTPISGAGEEEDEEVDILGLITWAILKTCQLYD